MFQLQDSTVRGSPPNGMGLTMEGRGHALIMVVRVHCPCYLHPSVKNAPFHRGEGQDHGDCVCCVDIARGKYPL